MEALLEMAGKAGMNPSQGEAATGGVMSLLKNKLDAGQFSKIAENVPGVSEAADKHERAESGGGGMGGMLGSAMSSFGGGGEGTGGSGGAGSLASLTALLGTKGVDPGMLSKFLPLVIDFIKQKCGVDVSSMLGGSGGGTSSGGSESAGGSAMSSLSGMASGFMK